MVPNPISCISDGHHNPVSLCKRRIKIRRKKWKLGFLISIALESVFFTWEIGVCKNWAFKKIFTFQWNVKIDVRSMTPTPSSPSHHWLIEKYLTVLTFQLPLHSYLSVALSPPIVLLSPLSQGTPQRCRPVLVSGHFTIQNLGNGLGFKKHVYSSGEDRLLISDHHFKPPGQRWSPPLISSLYHSWSARTSRWSLSTTRLLSNAI